VVCGLWFVVYKLREFKRIMRFWNFIQKNFVILCTFLTSWQKDTVYSSRITATTALGLKVALKNHFTLHKFITNFLHCTLNVTLQTPHNFPIFEQAKKPNPILNQKKIFIHLSEGVGLPRFLQKS
jgi:hypothetical protein